MNLNLENENKGNVLIVDDILENLQLLSDALSKLGYIVRSVTSGKMALKTVKVKRPDVILLDIKMPEMDGYEVCRTLKADDNLRSIPVIFISALDDVFDKVTAFESGGIDYITKPFQIEEVVARLENQLTIQLQQRLLEQENIKRREAEFQLQQQAQNLELTLCELKRTQAQLIQSEKMSSIGNLVAGVAHEINNPVNFIHGNLIPATEYLQDLLHLVKLYQQHFPDPPTEIKAQIEAIHLDFLQEDVLKLLNSMRIGTDRIREIVLSLRNFSRHDEAEFKRVDIHQGIDNTLMILQNRLNATPEHPEIVVIKDYDRLPPIECYSGQLNQVFMNLLNNAIDSVSTQCIGDKRQIKIQTQVLNSNRISIKISDNGLGIPQELQSKLFDPFFTTKPVGQGTGLGLFICHQIVVYKHGGDLYCQSTLGKGAEFVVEIPITKKVLIN